MGNDFIPRPNGCKCDNRICPQHNATITGRLDVCRCNIVSCPIHGIIRLQLTAGEAYLIRTMLSATLQQYNESSPEEQSDPDLIKMRVMIERMLPLLPYLELAVA